MVSPQPLPSPWPGPGWGGAVPLSFPSTREAPAPKGLRSWSIGERGETEPDSCETPSSPTPRKHEQERQQEVRDPRGAWEHPKPLGLPLCGTVGRHSPVSGVWGSPGSRGRSRGHRRERCFREFRANRGWGSLYELYVLSSLSLWSWTCSVSPSPHPHPHPISLTLPSLGSSWFPITELETPGSCRARPRGRGGDTGQRDSLAS